VQAGSLYKDFTNEEGLLFDIIKGQMDALLAQMRAALAPVRGAEARLLAFAGVLAGQTGPRRSAAAV
jgi:AcrR family transcriptional regulator